MCRLDSAPLILFKRFYESDAGGTGSRAKRVLTDLLFVRLEFRPFWPRLRNGGLLVSHDAQMNAAFHEFVTKTYAHKKRLAAATRNELRTANGGAGVTSASLLGKAKPRGANAVSNGSLPLLAKF